ncbi:MAG: AAA family ATPase [Planctomycetaceae bacterium]
MYEEFFGLSRRPFSATPCAETYVALESIEEARAALEACVRGGQGIGVVTGPAGTGKSLLCLRLRDALRDRFVPILLSNANFPTRRGLLQAILFELNHPGGPLAAQELRIALQDHLRTVRPEREGIALIVDEAHLLSDRLLEELRTIAQLAADGAPLVRVVLAGQLLLEEKLAEPALEALNQRIVCQTSIEPLTQRESAEFLARRIEMAGGEPRDVFPGDAAQAICQAADGNPRCLTQLADHALLLAFANEERPVSRATVLQALDDLRRLPLQWSEPAGGFAAADAEPAADGAGEIDGADSFLRDDANANENDHPFDDLPAEPNLENEFSDQDWDDEPEAAFEVGHSIGDESATTATTEGDVEVAHALEVGWNVEESPLDDAPPEPPPFVGPPEADSPRETFSAPVGAIEERPVIDRYAWLDAGLPFPEESPAAAGRTAGAARAASPARRIDAMLPLLSEALRPLTCGETGRGATTWTASSVPSSNEADVPGETESFGEIESFAMPADSYAGESDPMDGERGAADGGDDEEDSFEARLGNEVLEVCLETQQALDARLAATEPHRETPAEQPEFDATRSEWDDAEWDLSDADRRAASDAGHDARFDAEYDVVEPEPAMSWRERTGSPAPRPEGRRDYRRLFSALRRRDTARE